VFFAREAFGEDRLVTGDPMRMVADDIPPDRMNARSAEAFVGDFPLPAEMRAKLALLYTSIGLPIARFAERSNRVNLISVSILIWSGCTALCGIAQTFWQLLFFRAGVGIGEAGLSPAAHSLISDYFEPRQRASALSVYALGIPIGGMIAAIAGGWVAQEFGWRWALMLVGLLGVLIVVAFRAFIREPRRDSSAAPISFRHEGGTMALGTRSRTPSDWV